MFSKTSLAQHRTVDRDFSYQDFFLWGYTGIPNLLRHTQVSHSCLVLSEVLSLISSMSYIPLYPHGYTPCLVAIFPGLLSIAQEISAQVREICHPEGGHSATGRWSRWLLDGGWGGALTFCWNQLFCNIYTFIIIYIHYHIYIYNIYINIYIWYIYIW